MAINKPADPIPAPQGTSAAGQLPASGKKVKPDAEKASHPLEVGSDLVIDLSL